MNLVQPSRSLFRLLHMLFLRCRFALPRQRCGTFWGELDDQQSGIGRIFVINLDRETSRWKNVVRELDWIVDASGKPLSARAIRFSACDARVEPTHFRDSSDVDRFYTLGDQLYVEPQPHALPDAVDLESPISMSQAEVAVACSHIGVWKAIAQSSDSYTMVLEDDVWFEQRFGRTLERAWREMEDADPAGPKFDMLYVSYREVRHGAPKEPLSKNTFRPERGLWYLSGYILSKEGAQALIDLLPCRGPIDLWTNHQFRELEVRALRRSVVNQRRDLHSTNSYSILPALSRIGVLSGGDAALFHRRPTEVPVLAFGAPGTGLSSLAMAISMLGYRCCSDLEDIPKSEFDKLLAGRTNRVFDAYVNIGSLDPHIRVLRQHYPGAKYVVINDGARSANRVSGIRDALKGADVLHLHRENISDWRALCEHLRLAPPDAQYPVIRDIGLREQRRVPPARKIAASVKLLRHDPSPWIAKSRAGWTGISASPLERQQSSASLRLCFEDHFGRIQSSRWQVRSDTFAGNLALFRPANVTLAAGRGVALAVHEKPVGVRAFTAAAISTRSSFHFGRFETTLRATDVPGLVTGFFLHRDSPRQEIDVEIRGNRPDQLLVNVFYNPGTDGAKFDYGYRGTPAIIDLEFDASKASHQFTIEWEPLEIRWLVDQKLVHRRANWDPTPIPHLAMKLHVNTWPTRSRALAGRLRVRKLPASAIVRRIAVHTFGADGSARNWPPTAGVSQTGVGVGAARAQHLAKRRQAPSGRPQALLRRIRPRPICVRLCHGTRCRAIVPYSGNNR